MRKNILCIGLTILFCFALSACSSTNVSNSTSTQSEPQEKEITLYANFASGSAQAQELDRIKSKTVTVEEITAKSIAEKLSQWSGLDFTINSETVSETSLTVDWSLDSTLIANLDDREQKEDFTFFDEDSMRWFMMDSLAQTCMENMNISEVYYTMDKGKELSFEGLYPVSIFPKDTPYMNSPFYFAHADVKGDVNDNVMEETSVMGNVGNFAPTEGLWRLYGETDTAFIIMDGKGLCTSYYASGAVESDGYLTYDPTNGYYNVFNYENTLMFLFYISDQDENKLIIGYDEQFIYIKDGNTSPQNIPVIVTQGTLIGITPMEMNNDYNGGYYYSDLTEDDLTIIINTAFTTTQTAKEDLDDYIARCAKELSGYEVNDLSIKENITHSNRLTYPVYLLSWSIGANEDARHVEAFFFMTDTHTYIYAFKSLADYSQEIKNMYLSEFGKLTLN
jgi:hypothetical protein